jgi:hypothetical protein
MSEEGESQSTTTTKPKPPYRGITRHAGRWLVKLRHGHRDMTIGHYECAEDAAWAADFARYLLLGLNPTCWGCKVIRPNFPPSDREAADRGQVLRRLFRGRVSFDLIVRRLGEYDAAVRANREGSAG